MNGVDQPAALQMSKTGTPAEKASEAAIPLVECALTPKRGEARGLVTGRDCLDNPSADSMLGSRETSPGRTNAHKQLVRPSPLGSSVDVCVKCSHRTHTVKLRLI